VSVDLSEVTVRQAGIEPAAWCSAGIRSFREGRRRRIWIE